MKKKRGPLRMFDEDATLVFTTPAADCPPRVRQSFAQQLNIVLTAIGPAPRFAGDESQEEMVAAEKQYLQRKRIAERKYEAVIKNIKEMADEYPILKRENVNLLKVLK